MKAIVFYIGVSLFAFSLRNELFSGFVDLGSDPKKVVVSSVKKIEIVRGIENSYQEFDSAVWSPDGNFFALDLGENDRLETLIYDKDGHFIARLIGRFSNWSLNSQNIVCHEFRLKKLFIYDVASWRRRVINNKLFLMEVAFLDNSNCLVGYKGLESPGGAIQSVIFKMDIEKGNETELFRTESGTKIVRGSFKYFSGNEVFFSVLYKSGKSVKGALCRLDLNTGKATRLHTNTYSINVQCFIISKNEIRILIDSDYGSKIVMDRNGNTVNIVKNKPWEEFIKSGRTIIYGKTEEELYTKIIPNNKLLLIGKGTEGLPDESLIDEFIYLSDFKGNSKRLDLPNPSRCIAFSPSGNVFLGLVATTTNETSEDRVFLKKPAKRVFKLIQLKLIQ